MSMKTAISIPDDLFEDAERLAASMQTSRSRLYCEAIREYVARHSPDAITDALNEVCDREGTKDPFLDAAGRRTLERTEW